MGKKSLIKSTANKKATRTKKTSPEKPGSKAKTPVKTKKTKGAAKTKKTIKKTSTKKIKTAKKKITVKDLLLKKFKTTAPKKIFGPDDFHQIAGDFTAPPFILSDNDKDNKKIKNLLFNTYNMGILEAAAEKAAAEKAAAEKAAAEKAAAEKAAAEKAAAEKAAAEKAAAEKAAAEKADPMNKTIKFAAIGLGLIFIILIAASISNSCKYYLVPADGAIEIWQGDFAPMGKKLLLSIPGAEMPLPAKPEYSKKEVFPMAFSYYMAQADALAEIPGMPDFEDIETYLHKALDYATDRASMETANVRVNTIKMLVLLYKAEAAAGQATPAGLESAADYLEEAAMLDIDAMQLTLVKEKIRAVAEMKTELAALQAAEDNAAVEETQKAAVPGETRTADTDNPAEAEKPGSAAEKGTGTE